MNILTPAQLQQPRIVSLADLKKHLLPLARGDKWAEGTIVDLWKKGAPVPQAANEPERRILIPEQFKLWFADFAKRVGATDTPSEVYASKSKLLSSTSGSLPKHRRRE